MIQVLPNGEIKIIDTNAELSDDVYKNAQLRLGEMSAKAQMKDADARMLAGALTGISGLLDSQRQMQTANIHAKVAQSLNSFLKVPPSQAVNMMRDARDWTVKQLDKLPLIDASTSLSDEQKKQKKTELWNAVQEFKKRFTNQIGLDFNYVFPGNDVKTWRAAAIDDSYYQTVYQKAYQDAMYRMPFDYAEITDSYTDLVNELMPTARKAISNLSDIWR